MDYYENPQAFSQTVIAALLEDGSDPSAIYTIEHHFSSSDFDRLEKAAVAAFKLDYEVSDAEEFETDDGQEILAFDVFAEAKLELAEIEKQVAQMEDIARQYKIQYDGWGTEFLPLDDE
ncbi:ribonuclease E inhibitor RraB [Catenovulum sediminis]|uniref:Ribonuclease E inhibitor RraB n=1 Tax=Catenovulum sediminis TaxID=1740262 RepID=A0ABV1RGT3_9ALTE|nr:ribonuclease E inhibitor RraB [Catenovulum sediminis]